MVEDRSISIIAADPLSTRISGSDHQVWLLAKNLSTRGWRVRFLSHGERYRSLNEKITNDGVEIIWLRQDMRDIKYLRAVSYVRRLLSTLGNSNDIVLQTNPRVDTGLAAYHCSRNNIPFIYRAAHVFDADLSFKWGWRGQRRLTKILYRYGVSKATAIVANAHYVIEKFRENPAKNFRRNCIFEVIKNGVSIAKTEEVDKEPLILYAASLVDVKRPELFVQLARSIPEYRFVMFGSGPLEGVLTRRAHGLKNFEFRGFAPKEELLEYYRRAAIFVNTSLAEGFPNTLLDCGVCKTPYVSFVDPDGVISRFGIGIQVEDFQGLVNTVRRLMDNDVERSAMGDRIRSYVEENHSVESMVNSYERLFAKTQRLSSQ